MVSVKRPKVWRVAWGVIAATGAAVAMWQGSSRQDAPAPSRRDESPGPAAATVAARHVESAQRARVDSGDHVTEAPCGVDLPSSPSSIDSIPDAVLAKAFIPSLDPARMVAAIASDDAGARGIVDCQGHLSLVDWSDEQLGAPEGAPTPEGTVEPRARQALGDGRVAVWVATGRMAGASATDNGFWAVLHLEGARVVVDGAAPWGGFSTDLRIEQLGGGRVLVTGDGFGGSGVQRSRWETVWATREGRLLELGTYDTAREAQAAGAAAGSMPGDWDPPELMATPEFRDGILVVHEKWSWSLYAPDASAALTHKLAVDRRYRLVGDALVAEGDAADPAPPPPPTKD
jgi:hypothetical protein